MTFATIMVNLALGGSNGARLEVACQLAERFGAGIIGIAAAQFAPPLYFLDGARGQDLIDQGQAKLKERFSELEAELRRVIKNRAECTGWRSAFDFPARFILQEARGADIIVDGGYSPAFSDAFSLASPRDLVMQTGRPLLVVPDGARSLDLRSALVAWKDTPEARRAIADAIPLLRLATQVTVAEIPEESDSPSAVAAGVRDVIAWLSRHGVSATMCVPERRRDAAVIAELETIAGDIGAGLVVAGAYGHSRFRELILGGMTQHLLSQSARCVLLSH